MDEALKRAACDSNKFDLRDDEDRKLDDTSDGIDWDEITATTQPDWDAGRFAFDSSEYPTEEAAMAAMRELLHSIVEKAWREATSSN